MTATPWIVIAASIAAVASLINIYLTTKAASKQRTLSARTEIAKIKIEQLNQLSETISEFCISSHLWQKYAGKDDPKNLEYFERFQHSMYKANLFIDPEAAQAQSLSNALILENTIDSGRETLHSKISQVVTEFSKYKFHLLKDIGDDILGATK